MKTHPLRSGIALLGVGAAVMLLAVGTSTNNAQDASSRPADKADDATTPVIAVYNVADIIALSRDHSRDRKMAVVTDKWHIAPPYNETIIAPLDIDGSDFLRAPPEQRRRRRADTRRIDADDLYEMVTGNLDVDGRGVKRVSLAGHLLIVNRPRADHEKIRALLDSVRDKLLGVRTVTIEARWVRLTAAQLDGIGRGPNSPPQVPPAALKEATEVARAEITCLDRQTVHLLSGRGESLVSDVDPIISENVAASDPNVVNVFWGASLEATPVLDGGGKTVTIDLASVVSRRRGMRRSSIIGLATTATQPAVVAQAGIDHPEYDVDTFATTVRVPLGKAVLVAGAAGGKDATAKGLHLVLTVTAGEKPAKPK